MNNNNILSTLGLCRRGGKLVMGYDPCIEAIYKGTVTVILLAKDLSPKTAKGIYYACEDSTITIIATDFTMDEFADGVGKRTGIVAITDAGFAKKFRTLLLK